MKFSRRRVRNLRKRVASQLGIQPGGRSNFDRKTVDRACHAAGITVAEEFAVAWVLFGPASAMDDIASTLDESTIQMLADLDDVSASVADTLLGDDLF